MGGSWRSVKHWLRAGRMPGDRTMQTGATENLSYWKASFRAHRTVPNLEEGRLLRPQPTNGTLLEAATLAPSKGGGLRGAGVLPLRRLLAQFDPRRLLASPPLAHLARGTSPTLVRGRGGEGGGAGSLQLLEVTPRCLRQVFPKSSHLNTAHTVLAKLEDSSPSHSTHLVRAVCAEA